MYELIDCPLLFLDMLYCVSVYHQIDTGPQTECSFQLHMVCPSLCSLQTICQLSSLVIVSKSRAEKKMLTLSNWNYMIQYSDYKYIQVYLAKITLNNPHIITHTDMRLSPMEMFICIRLLLLQYVLLVIKVARS